MTTLSMLLGGMGTGRPGRYYLNAKGVLVKNNAQLVSRTSRIAREPGFELVLPEEAREIL
jgi:uncharacterized protein (DUF849 family)